ncbi:hypothetical protein SNE40_007814 [Patella caerulea]|uniref:RING-type domain-containing protein n=1 Tax=Patella caerulea TaxID=87958 RepID=A0AAN8JYN7_PATCE
MARPWKISRKTAEMGVGIILRTPALFILEVWYKTDPLKTFEVTSDTEIIVPVIYHLVFVLAIAIATLPLKQLVTFYMYLVSCIMLLGSYLLSSLFVENESQEEEALSLTTLFENRQTLERIVLHLLAQCFISALIAYLVDMNNWAKFLLLIFTTPVFARLTGFPTDLLYVIHNFASVFTSLMVLFYLFNNLGNIIDICKDGINQVYFAVKTFGPIPVAVTFWHSVALPIQLLLFWTLMFASQLYTYFTTDKGRFYDDGWLVLILAGLGECCATPVSLFAFCVTISYTSYGILTLTKFYLQGWEAHPLENDAARGWTEGFTMLLIAVQTDLLDLTPMQRAFLMSILLFIVLSSLIQSMYEIADPVLLSLSASHNPRYFRHIRAVALCTFLWIFPLFMSYMICQYFDLDFWLMVIISSCLLTSVQVIGSLVVYSLFIYDSLRSEPWESLDDVIYWARSCTRVLEFLVAVFVVCYGLKESLLGEWSWVNSSILLIHCYFNVWQRLQSGWKSFLLRWEAVKKVESLPLATQEQLEQFNDVCSICFQEMKSARITYCKHYFHGVCLRKWLYVKESCPMCHQHITGPTPTTDANPHQQDPNDNVQNNDIDDGDGLNQGLQLINDSESDESNSDSDI